MIIGKFLGEDNSSDLIDRVRNKRSAIHVTTMLYQILGVRGIIGVLINGNMV